MSFCHVSSTWCDKHKVHKCNACTESLPLSMNERVVRLEAHLNYQIDENRKVSLRIDELKCTLNLHASAIAYKDKKPHKCPVCDGKGKKLFGKSGCVAGFEENCYPCQGKGIVWG